MFWRYCNSNNLSVKESTKPSKLLSEAIDMSKKIVAAIEYLLKSEAVFGRVKENLEENVAASLAKLSKTRRISPQKCFKTTFEKYGFLQRTWKKYLEKVGLNNEAERAVFCRY